MNYQIVIADPNGVGCEEIVGGVAEFVERMEINGFVFAGFEDSRRLRPELFGQPRFKGLIGPMYGGPGAVRYENQAAYDRFSA